MKEISKSNMENRKMLEIEINAIMKQLYPENLMMLLSFANGLFKNQN